VKASALPLQEAREALADAQAEADRMGRLVNNLLMLTRADLAQQTGNNIAYGYKKYQDQ
jgi:signal transduction histidine kinase